MKDPQIADPVSVEEDATTDPDSNGGKPVRGRAAEPEPAVRSLPDGEVEVTCPGCGLTLVGEEPRPTAAWFCPRCDYPLFWAAEPPPSTPPVSRAARRRLPGTAGRQVLGAEPCWHCGEQNDSRDAECGRCAATIPKPLAPKVEVPVPYPVPMPYAIRPVAWPFIAAGACGGAAIAAALTTWMGGG